MIGDDSRKPVDLSAVWFLCKTEREGMGIGFLLHMDFILFVCYPIYIERNLFIIQKQQGGIALVDSGGVPGDDGKGSSGFKKWAFAVLLLFFGLFLPNFTVVKPYEPLPAQVMQIAQENDISGGYYVTSENGSYNIHVDGGLFHLNRGNRVTCKTAAPRRLNNIFHCHIKAVNPGNVFLKNRKYNDTLNK